jgi:(p)ppGpp synthase/HD superfamily hydrolase
MALVLRAAQFAAQRHSNQRRKGPDQEPYVNHVIEVAHILAASAQSDDAVLLAAAFLHDTIEDTETTQQELVTVFGAEVALVVAEVTDDKALEAAERKRLQVKNIRSKSRRAQLLSIADKTANIGSLVRSPPNFWSNQRTLEYLEWAERVVTQVQTLDPYLDREFKRAGTALRLKLEV